MRGKKANGVKQLVETEQHGGGKKDLRRMQWNERAML